MDDDLNILKAEDLRNLLLDLPQLLNLSLCDQTKNENFLQWGQPSMEADLENIKSGSSGDQPNGRKCQEK